MSGPKRVQMSRRRPWRADHPDAVIVARPSKWGNPWRVQARRYAHLSRLPVGWDVVCVHGNNLPMIHATFQSKVDAVGHAVQRFREHFEDEDTGAGYLARLELAGRDLACWCPLDQPCHADVLLEIANRERP